MNHTTILGLKRSTGFTSSDNQFFPPERKLEGLNHQHKLALRGIIQSDIKHGTKQHLTASEIAEVIQRQGPSIAKVNTYYNKAINNERKKTVVVS